MLYRHVFGKISSELRGISRVFVNFAGFLDSVTARNIRSPVKGNAHAIVSHTERVSRYSVFLGI